MTERAHYQNHPLWFHNPPPHRYGGNCRVDVIERDIAGARHVDGRHAGRVDQIEIPTGTGGGEADHRNAADRRRQIARVCRGADTDIKIGPVGAGNGIISDVEVREIPQGGVQHAAGRSGSARDAVPRDDLGTRELAGSSIESQRADVASIVVDVRTSSDRDGVGR